MDEKVELRLAFAWTCPGCGIDHFENAVIVEFNPNDNEDIEPFYNDDLPLVTGNWVTKPDTVLCKSCQKEFETENFGESDEYGEN